MFQSCTCRSRAASNKTKATKDAKPKEVAKRSKALDGDHFRRWDNFDVEAALAEASDNESDDSAHERPPRRSESPIEESRPQENVRQSAHAAKSPAPQDRQLRKARFSFDASKEKATTQMKASPSSPQVYVVTSGHSDL